MSAPFEETPRRVKDLLPPPAPAWPPAKVSRLGLIAVVIVLTIMVLLLGALLLAVHETHSGSSNGTMFSAPTIPPGWHRYSDPGGYFSVALPDGWTAQRETGTATMGDTQGSVTVQDVFDTFGGPPWGQNTITVQVYVEPIINDFERQWMCKTNRPPQYNAMVGGLPAVYDPVFGWLVNSNNAHFQISYEYPNWKGDENVPINAPTATPMPPGFYQKGQREMQTIIASFAPTPATPLACK